jgi:hypothetical protein
LIRLIYMKVQEIHQQGYIVQRLSLTMVNEELFVYTYEGNIVQNQQKRMELCLRLIRRSC